MDLGTCGLASIPRVSIDFVKVGCLMEYGYGRWLLVLVNVVLFGSFVSTLSFKKKLSRRSASLYIAFITALFAEMYGFPLTIYILTWIFNYTNPLSHMEGHLLAEIVGPSLFFSVIHPITTIMIFGGVFLVATGWKNIHSAADKRLVTEGVYKHVRHPQYLGFLLITTGLLIQWTTIPAVVMWPVLVASYYRLAGEEEKEMEQKYGKAYLDYKRRTPMLFPV
jgi:protein-S-isoprenylcysteine O-methyltransferase Ste14